MNSGDSLFLSAETGLVNEDHPEGVAVRRPIYSTPSHGIAATQMTAFTAALEAYTGEVFPDYEALHNFSVR